jgi:hypothetical protein
MLRNPGRTDFILSSRIMLANDGPTLLYSCPPNLRRGLFAAHGPLLQ